MGGSVCKDCFNTTQKSQPYTKPADTKQEISVLDEKDIFFDLKPVPVMEISFEVHKFDQSLRNFNFSLKTQISLDLLEKEISQEKKTRELKNLTIPKSKKMKAHEKTPTYDINVNNQDLLSGDTIPDEKYSPTKLGVSPQIKKPKAKLSKQPTKPVFYLKDENKRILFAKNYELEGVESFWAMNNVTQKKIMINEYEIIETQNNSTLKVQEKTSLGLFKITIHNIAKDNIEDLVYLYSQVSILKKLKKIKGVSSLITTNFFVQKENLSPGHSGFKVIKMQESGVCPLKKLLDTGFKFTPLMILPFLKKILITCQKSEQLGIANRQINPNNIYLSQKIDEFTIYDYSLAVNLNLNHSEKEIVIPNFPTMYFQAPEIYESKGDYKMYNPFLADVFSLGLVILAALGIGEKTIEKLTKKEEDINIVFMNLESSELNEIKEILQKMLVVNPEKRADFNQLVELMKDYKENKTFIYFNSIAENIEKLDLPQKDYVYYEKIGDFLYSIGNYDLSFNNFMEALKELRLKFPSPPIEVETRLLLSLASIKFEQNNFNIASGMSELIHSKLEKLPNLSQNPFYLEVLKKSAIMDSSIGDLNHSIEKLTVAMQLSDNLTFQKKNQELIEIYKVLGVVLLVIKTKTEKGFTSFFKALEIINSLENSEEKELLLIEYIAESFAKLNILTSSVSMYQKTIDLAQKSFGLCHPIIVFSYSSLGELFLSQNELLKSKTFFKRSLNLAIKTFGSKSYETGLIKAKLAKILLILKDSKQAIKYLQESLDICYKYEGESKSVAEIWNSIGSAFAALGEYEKAHEFYEKAFEFHKELVEKGIINRSDTLPFMEDIGNLYALQGDKKKALSYFYQSLIIRKELYGDNSVEVANCYEFIGDMLIDLEEYETAIENYRNSFDVYSFNEPQFSNNLIKISYYLGQIFYSKGDRTITLEYLNLCLKLQEKYYVNLDSEKIESQKNVLNLVSHIFFENCDYDQSVNYMMKALNLMQDFYKKETEEIADFIHNVGVIYYKMNQPKKAENFMIKSLEIKKKLLGIYNSTVIRSVSMLCKIYKDMKNKNEEIKYQKILEDILANIKIKDQDSPLKTGLMKVPNNFAFLNKVK